MKKMKPPKLVGYQTAFTLKDSDGNGEVCIYGNRAGLRSLARLLEYIADLDQKSELFPGESDSFHHHVMVAGKYPGHSQRITIGRADDKNGKRRFDVFPRPGKKTA